MESLLKTKPPLANGEPARLNPAVQRAAAKRGGPLVMFCDLLAILSGVGVHGPVARVAFGPYEQEQIVTIRVSANLANELVR
jgi:hypothetical protein